ncbi:MAG: membrane-bound lytic murein transglycosylase MltF, partial [Gammaproteobacteria bacterium]|nr:membrane-bound lytic murein transglycosylase MltF [Gammaproteobacteria bacterium]
MRFFKWQFALFLAMGCSMAASIGAWSLWREAQLTPHRDLKMIKAERTLTVLTRNAPTTYFQGRDGPTGFEYQLTQALAEYMGVSVNYRFLDSMDDIMQAIRSGTGDIAAAGITRLPQRDGIGLFTPAYMDVRQQVVCRREVPSPKQAEDLPGLSILVPEGTSYVVTLRKLQRNLPELRWVTTDSLSTEQLFEQITNGAADCTVADSNIVAINQRFYPHLRVAMNLTPPQHLAWLLPEHATALHAVVSQWFDMIRKNGQLKDIYERNYGHIKTFDYVDTRVFQRRIQRRLPRYRPHFEEAGTLHQLPWTLLAALSYQESHWNNHARSPTGVRGIMMLTLDTARTLGLNSRLDPEQSIEAGARYLRALIDRLPDDIDGEDRIWIGLAAYNIGMGHILDSRG